MSAGQQPRLNPEPRLRKRKRPVSKVRLYWWLLPVLIFLALLGWIATGPQWSGPRAGKTTEMKALPGYISDFATVMQEYRRFYGKPLEKPELAKQFEAATQVMTKHDYLTAAGMLEEVAKQAAVPAVFNDLGLVYRAQNDRANALKAFREALARDKDYRQVRMNLEDMKDIALDMAAPVSHEFESNNSLPLANIIALDKPVEGEIMAAVNDVDTFKVTTPAAPRDIISIEVEAKSRTLSPEMKLYDPEHHLLDWVKGNPEPGHGLSTTISPPPNTDLYIQLMGVGSSAGVYTLLVKPLKKFDGYEPNDEIFNAHKIALGEVIEAGIMDQKDTDFYSFETPRAGRVAVNIVNRSASLIPALSTFTPNQRSSGFGPDVRTRGANLTHSFAVEKLATYYIQVWAQANTSGAYRLTVKME
jgi:hypothetical protein